MSNPLYQRVTDPLYCMLQLKRPAIRKRADRIMVDETHKLVYCPIPKNACTFFVRLVLENSSLAEAFRLSQSNPHDFRRASSELRLNSGKPLTDPKYFRFLIIRDPIERVISAYLNKFVRNTNYPQALRATQRFRQRHTRAESNELLSFAQFVEHLSEESPSQYDVHWRPQHLMIEPFAKFFDVIATMESIPTLVDLLAERIGKELPCVPTANRNLYHHYPLEDKLFDASPSRLRALDRVPAPDSLLSEDLRQRLKAIYRTDTQFYQSQAQRSLYAHA